MTYNRADLLARSLAALVAQTRPPDAVIVVDNASTDHTAEVLDAATNPGLQRIHLPDNTGGAGGFPRRDARRPTSRASTGSG